MLLYLLLKRGEKVGEVCDGHSQTYYKQDRAQQYCPFNAMHQKTDNGREGEDGGKDNRAFVEFSAF